MNFTSDPAYIVSVLKRNPNGMFSVKVPGTKRVDGKTEKVVKTIVLRPKSFVGATVRGTVMSGRGRGKEKTIDLNKVISVKAGGQTYTVKKITYYRPPANCRPVSTKVAA